MSDASSGSGGRQVTSDASSGSGSRQVTSDASSGSGGRQLVTIQPSLFDPLPEPAVEPPPPLEAPPDQHAARLVGDAPPPLAAFNAAGILDAADVHVATALGRLLDEHREEVVLAAAFAVRGPRLGHVCIDLAALPLTVATDSDTPVDVAALPWPDPDRWVDAVTTSPLVAHDDEPVEAPLRLVGGRLYVDRYWRYERAVADGLARRGTAPPPDVDLPTLRAGLARLFQGDGDGPDLQRLAAAAAVLRPFSVVAGGPGTGKTATVAQILALLDEQAATRGDRPPRIALAAPTGKAASGLEESIREAAEEIDADPAIRERLASASASTLHRLLGTRPGSRTRFRHDAATPLPHDVVVVDETSMVSLALMAKLVDAVRPDARLILVGDPDQLASVEAGAVLGDIVGPAREGLLISSPVRDLLSSATGEAVPADDPPRGADVADGIVVLRRVHRFAGGIAELARAVQDGDGEGALAVLAAGREDVTWIETEPETSGPVEIPEPLKELGVETGRATVAAARAGEAAAALAALGAL
ncbi:MAG: AAA family ATPase, partial [Nitriliruptorales bacterium]